MNGYYVCNVESKKRKACKDFKVEHLSATWTKDTELFDATKLTDNKTLKKILKGKTTENKKETTENKKETPKGDFNGEKEEEEITPLFDEKILFKLLNLFEYEFENVEQVISILCHSPYP